MVEMLNPWAICLGCEQSPTSEPKEPTKLKRYKFMVDGCERIDVYEDDKGEWIHDPDHKIQAQPLMSEPPREEALPSVSGMLEGSLADHERSLLVKLMDEQAKINPDNSLISVLCDAVRVGREYVYYQESS